MSFAHLTPSEQRLTRLARRLPWSETGINAAYSMYALEVQYNSGQYGLTATNQFGRRLGRTVREAEATLRALLGDAGADRPHAWMSSMMELLLPMPTPRDIGAARQRAGHTQAQAAEIVDYASNSWASAERGEARMSAPVWTLYLLATDQHPAARVVRRRQ